MKIPSALDALIIAAASYRIWRLLAEDTILNRPRRALANLPASWKEGDAIPKGYRAGLAEFLLCPWCLGAWVSLVVYVVWEQFPGVAMPVYFVLAVSTAVGLIRVNLDPE